jgi:hypothetical protein
MLRTHGKALIRDFDTSELGANQKTDLTALAQVIGDP